MRCFSQMPAQAGSNKMKEAGDEFKNRFKKFTGPTQKRFKEIKPAELRQFVLEALGEQKAKEKLSDVGDDGGKLVEVAWQVPEAGINGQIILVDEDESDSEDFSSDDSEDSDSKGGQQSRNRGKAAKGQPTRNFSGKLRFRSQTIVPPNPMPDIAVASASACGVFPDAALVNHQHVAVIEIPEVQPLSPGQAVHLVALHRAVLESLEAHAQASAMHRGVDGTTDG